MSNSSNKVITKGDILKFFSDSAIRGCSSCLFSEECHKLTTVSRGYTTNSTDLCDVIRGEWEWEY